MELIRDAGVVALALCAAVLSARAVGELEDPDERARRVAEVKRAEDAQHAEAVARAGLEGLPLAGTLPGGGAWELAEFDGDQPLYRATLNASAAISTGANLLNLPPYGLTGSAGAVGLWDACSARTTHIEFGGRVTSKDGAGVLYDHSTHVAGTLCAAGVDGAAKGMAYELRVDSYDWNNDVSEMLSRGATYPGETGVINVSSHSYGMNAGWAYTGTPLYTWYGSGTDAAAVEDDFGKYNTYARDVDTLAYGLPYYLVFWAAGNDRGDNPSSGSTVAVTPGGASVAYNPTLHPPGDSAYRSGFDTISYCALAKNVLTVGAVADAVTSGVRDPAKAAMLSFSSWGPTDDGRIKPDVVANGYSVRSTSYMGDASYSYMSGTSMATPNAAGTAQLLEQWFTVQFTRHAMRASTLKAVLLHTATDLGAKGPDYVYGWGLVNAKGAADLLAAYRTNAGTRRVVEDRVATNRAAVGYSFTWGGAGAIRATLCWTDPAGPSTTTGDSRVPRLVNNLDLRIVGPDGTVHKPWVMPFVGAWSAASYASSATVGSNVTDNVEQVVIDDPQQPGLYTIHVTFAGALANGEQLYSLAMDGVAAGQAAPAPSLRACAPASGTGRVSLTLSGDKAMLGAVVSLAKAGQPDAEGLGIQAFGDVVRASVDTAGLAGGWWKVRLTNPDGQRAILYNAFAVPESFWSEDFETSNLSARGWSTLVGVGVSQWSLTMTTNRSPVRSASSPGAASRSDTSLVSPSLLIPVGAAALQVSFWHAFALEAGNDGGVLEFSLDGGGWFDIASSGAGASFLENGYNATISSVGAPSARNPLAGQSGWSGTSGGFVRVVIGLADQGKYGGHALRVRWRLGTNSSTASWGWAVDDVTLSGVGAAPPVPQMGTSFEVR